LFCDGQDGDIYDGNSIKWVEVVVNMEGTSISFYYAKPSGSVSSIGWFIRTGHYSVMNNFDEFVVETWWDVDILVDPQCMQNCWDADWRDQNSPFSSSIHNRHSFCSLTK
jgi:hypothetical protein